MKISYEKGTLSLDLHELLQGVKSEHRVELIESLACDDEIIRHVADQIIEGWTENSFSGGSVCTPKSDASTSCPLDIAWRRVAKMSGEVAKREIEKLERELKRKEDELDQMRQRESERINQQRRIY